MKLKKKMKTAAVIKSPLVIGNVTFDEAFSSATKVTAFLIDDTSENLKKPKESRRNLLIIDICKKPNYM